MKVIARAKVNLFLSIKGLRNDGFHEIDSVMQSVELTDELEIASSPDLTVAVDWGGEAAASPGNELVEQTLRLAGVSGSVNVRKRIPVGAGLGGGSADAAAALLVAASLGLEAGRSEEIATRLGSDIPFAAMGGTARVRGRGEIVEPLDVGREIWWVIAVPRFRLSTADVYARFDELGAEGGKRTPDQLIGALSSGDLPSVAGELHNDLDSAAFDIRPELAGLKQLLAGSGVLGCVMSGSGSAIAGLCEDRESAVASAEKVRTAFDFVDVVPSARLGAEVIDR